jgi:hypothetical protein
MNIFGTIPVADIDVLSPLSKDIEYYRGFVEYQIIYFNDLELIQDYTNTNDVGPTRIKIVTVPTTGDLSYGGQLVGPNWYINFSDLITGNSFGYSPLGLFQDGDGGDFPDTFTYRVLDAQDNASDLVTFNLNCFELTVSPPPKPYIEFAQFYNESSGGVYIPFGDERENSIEIFNPDDNAPVLIWIRLENLQFGPPGPNVTVLFRKEDGTTLEVVLEAFAADGQTSYDNATPFLPTVENAYLLAPGERLVGTLSDTTLEGSLSYIADMRWAYIPLGANPEIDINNIRELRTEGF